MEWGLAKAGLACAEEVGKGEGAKGRRLRRAGFVGICFCWQGWGRVLGKGQGAMEGKLEEVFQGSGCLSLRLIM